MYLVVDANILIAALIRDSTTRKLLLSEKFELVAPEFLAGEIDKHIAEISKKAKDLPGTIWISKDQPMD